MIARRFFVVLVALLVAVQLVRMAAVRVLAEGRPADASRLWSAHPDVELASGLTAIAVATRERKPVDPRALDLILDAARKEPLAPEPFLVRGVQAQLSGDDRLAEQAFLAAKWRDGRSLPARYFLADLYFRRGDSVRGLPEIGALARLAPNGVKSLAPYVATYAKNRSAWPQLKALFRSSPKLEESTLTALSSDAGNAETVLALASSGRTSPSSPWLAPLIDSLVKAGQLAKARQVWARVAQVRLASDTLLYDPGFTEAAAPPPFNWVLTSSTIGLAERLRGGGLHVIFYGQEDGALASQLLVLAPGRYRLTTTSSGRPTNGNALHWALTCVGTKGPFASIPLTAAIAGAWSFVVPPGCAGPRLELSGSAPDIPSQSEATIRSVSLAREPSNA